MHPAFVDQKEVCLLINHQASYVASQHLRKGIASRIMSTNLSVHVLSVVFPPVNKVNIAHTFARLLQ